MQYKKEITGAAVGLVSNMAVEKISAPLWAKLGQEAADKRKAVYDQARGEGKSEEEASAIAFKASPLWNKIGSRRLNGAMVAAIGLGTIALGQKELGKGIAAAGILKTIFPGKWLDLDFSEKL